MSNFVYQGVRLTYPHYMPNLDPLAKQEVVNVIIQKRKLDLGRVVSLLLLDDILSKVDDIFSISDDIFQNSLIYLEKWLLSGSAEASKRP